MEKWEKDKHRASVADFSREELIDLLIDKLEADESFWGAIYLRVKDPELLERLRDRAVYYGIIQP